MHISMDLSGDAHLHIDLVGPLQYRTNCNFIFTIIDGTSKWMEAIPLYSISAADLARALVFHWVTRYEVPDTFTSYYRPQFTSNLWAELCDMLNISHHQTTAYHPEVNNVVDRTMQSIDCIAASKMHFVPALPGLLGPRRSLGSSSDSIPSQGKTLVFPRLRQFLAHLLSYPMSFCRQKIFPLIKFTKEFPKS
jgi:hypothetical protein